MNWNPIEIEWADAESDREIVVAENTEIVTSTSGLQARHVVTDFACPLLCPAALPCFALPATWRLSVLAFPHPFHRSFPSLLSIAPFHRSFPSLLSIAVAFGVGYIGAKWEQFVTGHVHIDGWFVRLRVRPLHLHFQRYNPGGF